MRSKSRVLIVAAVAVVPLFLVPACGGDGTDAGSTNNLTPITGSSYVTIEPATTTTTTTLAPGETPGGLEPGTISPVEQQYTIQSGDSLSRIASLYDVDMETICAYNKWPDCIDPPHLLLQGDVVLIPPESQVPATGGGATTVPPTGGETEEPTDGTDGETDGETATDGECPTTYVIQSGDTTRLGVADKFGITYEQMDAANANTPGYQNFIVGTPITIPCPGRSSAGGGQTLSGPETVGCLGRVGPERV